jgi:hypothetical protein
VIVLSEYLSSSKTVVIMMNKKMTGRQNCDMTDRQNCYNFLVDLILKNPKALSPSSIALFKKCPQSFLFKYLFPFRKDMNDVTLSMAKDRLCHELLATLFDKQPSARAFSLLRDDFVILPTGACHGRSGSERKS